MEGCPFSGCHAPNGEEFALGCEMCNKGLDVPPDHTLLGDEYGNEYGQEYGQEEEPPQNIDEEDLPELVPNILELPLFEVVIPEV